MSKCLVATGKTRIDWFSLRIVAAMLLALPCRSAASATITGFSPSFGQPGNVITINGSGFTTATNLEFNPAAPTLGDFNIITDTQLTAVVPIGATSGPLSVGTSSNGTATSSASFTVAPAIASFSPQTGSAPTQVYILGANFIVGGTTVTFSGAAPVNGTVTASTVVSATVPAGAGDGPITVTTSAGSAVSTNIFTAGSEPTITSFSPASGTNGTPVVISGGNFFGTPTVEIGGKSASATVTSTTEINATVPAGATNGPITVTTTNGSFTTSSNFVTGPGPIITDFSPIMGADGTFVTNDGLNLSTVTNVTLNGVEEYISGYGSGYLLIQITNAPGSGAIKVFSAQGSFTTSSNFTYTTAPMVSDFAPALGEVGASVVIDGINFTGATAVKFGSVSAAFFVAAGTQINATVPSGAVTGPITVTSGSGSYTTSSNFVVTTSAPVITGFTPASGVRGTTVIINGGNFTNLSSVQFNGVTAAYTPPTSATVLYATVPAGAASGLISVKNSSGTGNSSALFYLQPWITNATASGIVNSSVVIEGRNLTNAGAVQVNGVNYVFTNSATQIVATVPSNATTGPITVTTPGGIFINTNSFVVLPKIYSFSPTIGPAGTTVTIDGTSLFDVTNVLFNGVGATPINVMTNQLQAAVPAGATPGPITVVTAGGDSVSSNSFTATSKSAVDLSKTVSPAITATGSNVTYTLVVTNAGPSTVTSLSVTDNIPAGFNLTSSASSLGTTVYTNNMVIASLGTLASNTSATITVQGTSTIPGTLTNAASLGFAEGETIYGTNYASAVAYFISAAQRTLSIAASTNADQFLVTWPVSAVNFTLQVNTNLNAGGGWQNVAGNTNVTNGLNEYSNSFPSLAAEFFRLHTP
jgi:large repetitive protein